MSGEGGEGFGIYPLRFVKDSTSSNYFVGNDDSGVSSQYVPEIVPVDSIIFLATFYNRRTGVDLDAQFLAAPMGTPNNAAVTIINWQIRNKRGVCACFSVQVNACDKIALFVKDQGTNPTDPRFTLWLKPVNADCIAGSENLSPHFPSTGGTTST